MKQTTILAIVAAVVLSTIPAKEAEARRGGLVGAAITKIFGGGAKGTKKGHDGSPSGRTGSHGGVAAHATTRGAASALAPTIDSGRVVAPAVGVGALTLHGLAWCLQEQEKQDVASQELDRRRASVDTTSQQAVDGFNASVGRFQGRVKDWNRRCAERSYDSAWTGPAERWVESQADEIRAAALESL